MAAPSAAVAHHRARNARLRQSYPPDHPKVIAASQELKAVVLEQAVQKALAEAPPLTAEQRDHIAAILRGGGA